MYHEHYWIATKCKRLIEHFRKISNLSRACPEITVFINKMEDCACFTDSDGKSDTENDLDDVEDTDDITVTRIPKRRVTDDSNT